MFTCLYKFSVHYGITVITTSSDIVNSDPGLGFVVTEIVGKPC